MPPPSAFAVDRSLRRLGWYRWRCTLRSRWGSYLVVVLLLGLIGGLAMGAMVAARRTQSAYPTFLSSSNAPDLQFDPHIDINSAAAQLYSPAFTRQMARLPGVRSVAAAVTVFAAPLRPDGKPYLPPPLANNEIDMVGPVDGLFYKQDRLVADQGRLPNPARADEFAISAEAAQLLHWHVGQVVPLAFYTLSQLFASTSGPPAKWLLRVNDRLVGLVAGESSVVNDEVDAYPALEIMTPALTDRLLSAGAAGFTNYYLRLDHGPAGVGAVEREVIAMLPRGSTYGFNVTSVAEGEVERAAEPESIALGAFAVIALLAAFIIVSQAINRGLRANGSDIFILRALGADPVMSAADSFLGMVGAIVAGALFAIVVCLALSPLSPLGVVREIDPSAGLDFDWTVIGVGTGLLVAGLVTVTVGFSYRTFRWRPGDRENQAGAQRPSFLVNAAVRSGLPPVPVMGARFAVERGQGRDTVPVGSALIGAAIAVAVVVTTFTFASGLGTLVSHPTLYGWNWSYAIDEVGGGSVPPVTGRLLDTDKYVTAWTGFDFANAQIGGQTIPILLETAGAPFGPPIVSGHGVQQPDQIVLGGLTMAQLHKRLGDTVVVSYGSPKNAPVFVPPTRLRIVGIATLPSIGNPGTLHVSMGTGAILSEGIEPAAMKRALTNPDPNQNGPDVVVIRLQKGVSPVKGLASLQRVAAAASAVVDKDPQTGGGTFVVLPVQQPAEIVNYRTMGDTPVILAAGLAFGAVVALGLTLVASVRRRRRDLALLKTLGFVPRQLSDIISWQASLTVLVGVAVGVPVGVLLGQAFWRTFAEKIYAVPRATVPAWPIALSCVLAIVLANMVAFIPGRIAARTPAAVLLRNE